MDGRPDDATQILLAEYAALRAEAECRATVQWNVVALQLASAGAVTGLAIASAANVALLLIVPLMSYMLGHRYLLIDVHLKLIRRYVRDSLSPRLSGHLQWEGWRDQELAPYVARQRWFTATGWNSLHPTRLAFQGVAVLALVGALGAGIFLWITRSPSWYVIAGFAVGWLIDMLATVFLHRSFDRAADDRVRRQP
ncbi:hypothetical protein [Kibdelosporangium aridum]|uniref:hypothetical protein n=1 Tax=Kibdelosporangium aridum TaxID=2030 RepID=UPI00052594B2